MNKFKKDDKVRVVPNVSTFSNSEGVIISTYTESGSYYCWVKLEQHGFYLPFKTEELELAK